VLLPLREIPARKSTGGEIGVQMDGSAGVSHPTMMRKRSSAITWCHVTMITSSSDTVHTVSWRCPRPNLRNT
jgi:hypothetical protein